MRKAVSLFVLPGLLASASLAQAQGPEIGHKAVGCIIVGQYPKMTACFSPRGSVARGRVYFKPQAAAAWYYVEMKSDAPCYAGVLPKPTRKLIDTKVLYYVQVVDKSFAEAQTAEFDPIVVEKESDCKDKLPIAPISRSGPAGVFPSVPDGFALGSGVSPLLVAGGVAVVGGGVAIGIKGKKGNPTPTPEPPTPAPGPTPTPNPTPTPTPTPTPGAGLAATCQAQPQSGPAPLDVAFATFPTGGAGSYEFVWDFGDGGSAVRSNPNHTYTASGTFNATVVVTSGGEQVSCSRTISVGTPPPPKFALSVAKAGTGAGTVTSSPAGINCGGTCSQDFTSGTVVALTPSPSLGSVFAGWSGACTGSTCTVTMDAAKSVTATFNLGNFPLSVTRSGAGTGTVTSSPPGISCGATCSFTYPGATVVTLTPTPDPTMFFVGWTGACSGTGGCSVTMDAAKTVDARFEVAVTLSVTKETGLGFGTVTSNPAGISCDGGCGFQSASFGMGTVVVLTATPDPGSVFANWTMDCFGQAGPTCTLTMTGNLTAGVKFDAIVPAPAGASESAGAAQQATPDLVPWTIRLEAAGARGQVAVNGQLGLSATPGVVQGTIAVRRGENRVEAWLTQGSSAGIWRFELGDSVEPGSLAVQAGDVQSVAGQSVAFRVRGTAGERFAFTFRHIGRTREGQR